jgi:hypothetical protein
VAAEWAWDPPALPWRAHAAEIRGRLVMIPVEATDTAICPHDWMAGNNAPDTRQRESAKRTLVIATCDPAASLLSTLCWQQKELRVLPVIRSSRAALDLLAAGKIHAAGVHVGCTADHDGNAALAQSGYDQGSDWSAPRNGPRASLSAPVWRLRRSRD